MRLYLFTLLATMLLFPGPATSLDEQGRIEAEVSLPPGTLNSAELLVLFNNKTVFSITAVKQQESVSYYDSNGVIRQQRNGIKRTGHWRVTENSRICLQMEELPEKCRIIVKEDGDDYKKYIVRKNGRHQHIVSYTEFRTGNPLGL